MTLFDEFNYITAELLPHWITPQAVDLGISLYLGE